MSQPTIQSSAAEKGERSNKLMYIYFSIIILTVLVYGVLPFFSQNLTLETQEAITKSTMVVLGLSHLLIPFTQKDKKRRAIALVLAILVAAFMIYWAL